MKKRSTRQKSKRAAKGAADPAQSAVKSAPRVRKPLSRRAVLQSAAGWGVLGLAAVGGGYLLIEDVMASAAEHDLTRIGQGTPSIVQIHDPDCSQCRQLQRTTRSALAEFEDGALTYLVANLDSPEGSRLARRHGVGNVTLLLFDGDGALRQTLQGLQSRDSLLAAFSAHMRAGRSPGS